MLIFLHGEDSFRMHERLEVLRQGFQEKYDNAGYNIQSFYGIALTIDAIQSSLRTAGLFVQKRFVVIHNVFDISDKVQTVLCDILPIVDSDTIIVCTTDVIPKKKSALKTLLTKADRVEEYSLLDDQKLRRWAQQRIAQTNATITTEAAAYLIHSVGNDLWMMSNVINQLVAFTQSIEIDDVRLFVQSPLDDNIFHLTDALSEQNTEQALRVLYDQFALGVNVFYLLTMLARQIRILIEVKETNGQGLDLHPYVIKKVQQHAQRFSLDALREMHHQLNSMDVQLKSTTVDPQLLFDRFVVEATK